MKCFYSKASFAHKDDTHTDICLYRKVGKWQKVEMKHFTMFDDLLSHKAETFGTLREAKDFYLRTITCELSTM